MEGAGEGEALEWTCEVTKRQESIEEARRFAEQRLGNCNPRCREAVAMAVQELAENLAKYAPLGAAGTIVLHVEGDVVTVRAINHACSRADGAQVEATIAEIAAAPSVRDLYRRRQQQLIESPSLLRTRLGLVRIAYEGGFRLSCVYSHPELEIAAERDGCRGE